VVEEKRFHQLWEREGWYPILSWGTYGGFRGFLVSPGKYTVKLTINGQDYTQQLEVRKDPHSAGTIDDIKAQEAFQKQIRAQLNTVSDIINEIEWLRKQLVDLQQVVKASPPKEAIIQAINEFNQKLRGVEDELFQHILAEGDSKSFRYPQKLYCKFSVLAEDVSKLADFAPNKQQKEVFEALSKRLEIQKQKYRQILREDLPAFNKFLAENGLAGIIRLVVWQEGK